MYRVAVVDDDPYFIQEIESFIKQFSEEEGQQFTVSTFCDGRLLVDAYEKQFDLILLDIEMPNMNGMQAAEEIRKVDDNVVLMFITNMAQYAIHGYEVGALDFIMKPLNYYAFALKLKRALKRVQKRDVPSILLPLPDGVKKMSVQQIHYVEVQNHMVHYHTEEGEFVMRGSLQSAERNLPKEFFVKCNHWYLVNLMHVKEVRKNILTVAEYQLEISRRNRAAFMKALTEYMGGNS